MIAEIFLALSMLAQAGDAQNTCLDIAVVEQVVEQRDEYDRLRAVEPEAMPTLLRLYQYAAGEPDPEWTHAMLVNVINNSGIVLYGTDKQMCGVLVVPPGFWDDLLPLIEMRKA